MKVKIFHSKATVFVSLFLFVMLLFSDTFPQRKSVEIGEVEKLIKEGESYFKKGEYYRALNKFFESENLLDRLADENEEERYIQSYSQIYLNLSLTYYATNQLEKAEENLANLFSLNPDMVIKEIEYPLGFIDVFNKVKANYAKPEEKEQKKIEPEKLEKEEVKPVVKEKPGEKAKKKKKKFPWLLVVGGVVVVGIIIYFLIKKKDDSHVVKSETEDVEIDWVEIPAGWFKMGDNFNEGDSNERPVHRVYLDSYYISKYEVTFEQYDAFCEETGRSKLYDEGWGRGDRPVINIISWNEAKAFCDWLSNKTGEDIHLPTEAQWEKAARGTDQRRYPWGNSSPNCNKANYFGCKGKTMPVGSYPAGKSPYGVHDMAGNVWEWCQDLYDKNYYGYSPSHNPQGPSNVNYYLGYVIRGGSYACDAYTIRSACRDTTIGDLAQIGFRIVKEK